jgi:hypothetical protein
MTPYRKQKGRPKAALSVVLIRLQQSVLRRDDRRRTLEAAASGLNL